MNYNDAFAIDNVSYLERKKDKGFTPEKYKLRNYDYHMPKLVNDFYLKYFTRQLLFEIDILEVKYYLDYHYFNSKNTGLYTDVLNLKILPKIEELIDNARPIIELEGNYYVSKLEDEFYEKDGVIHNRDYNYDLMLHQIDFDLLQADIKKRADVIKEFLESIKPFENDSNVLIWKGKASHLAFIISRLALEGYIESPENHDGEINYTELSRQILSSFKFKSKPPSVDTLRKYSDIDGDKVYSVKSKFENNGFCIPDSKLIG